MKALTHARRQALNNSIIKSLNRSTHSNQSTHALNFARSLILLFASSLIQRGPVVIFNEVTGVSLMVTRSLGDSLGPAAVLDTPQHATAPALPAGSRVVVASDGVWDVIDTHQAAAIVKVRSVYSAGERIKGKRKRGREREREIERGKDCHMKLGSNAHAL